MGDDIRKEISELRRMISDYIVFLKEFTMKTLETLRAIDRRLAALEARIIRGEIELTAKPTAPKPKPVVEKPLVPKAESKPEMPKPVISIAPKPKPVKPAAPSPFKEKKKEKTELPPDSMAMFAEAISELLDV